MGVLFSCVVFLIRRNVLKINRFKKIEMVGWPALDANLILVIEIVLMVAILGMNGADQILQDRGARSLHCKQAHFSLVQVCLVGYLAWILRH